MQYGSISHSVKFLHSKRVTFFIVLLIHYLGIFISILFNATHFKRTTATTLLLRLLLRAKGTQYTPFFSLSSGDFLTGKLYLSAFDGQKQMFFNQMTIR